MWLKPQYYYTVFRPVYDCLKVIALIGCLHQTYHSPRIKCTELPYGYLYRLRSIVVVYGYNKSVLPVKTSVAYDTVPAG